ncbi:MAG: hypothetical protein IT258_15655 [Saprospiraceae bacterium]|nr:hypothetical protein [Saprospiraceae bacterium]
MKVIFYLLSFFSAFTAFSQKEFPASWVGNWSGKLEIYTGTGKVQELPMELHIQPKDTLPITYTYEIVYGEDKVTGARPYELVVVDATKGLFMIDEKNSIKMEAYYLNGKLIQWFEVEGTLLFTTTELIGEELHWEIVSGSSTPVSTTGNQKFEAEEIPPVKTYPASAMQRAVLRRK